MVGCVGEKGPTGPPITGSLRGFVDLRNANGYEQEDKSGVLISVEGTPHNAISSDSGVWTLENLPIGTYNIRAEKQGYATAWRYGVTFIGNGTGFFGTFGMTAKPLFEMSNLEGTTRRDTIRLRWDVSYRGIEGDTRMAMFFVGADSSVNETDYRAAFALDFDASWPGTIWRLRPHYYTSWLKPFASGDTIHLAAYPAPRFYYYSAYVDPNTGRSVFPALGNICPNKITIVIP